MNIEYIGDNTTDPRQLYLNYCFKLGLIHKRWNGWETPFGVYKRLGNAIRCLKRNNVGIEIHKKESNIKKELRTY